MKNKAHLLRSSSSKELPKQQLKYELSRKENFHEFYCRYLRPMREKVEDYAEKINNLIKEKELEFFNMNEIIKNLISNFSKEKSQFEVEIRDKNISIVKLKETLENLKRANEEGSHRSTLDKEEAPEIDLPRQISSVPPKNRTLTPEKLYSFRAISAHENGKIRSKEVKNNFSQKM